jgi:mRNA deadenylase 3'-5' endonuclease subunit Ccr4
MADIASPFDGCLTVLQYNVLSQRYATTDERGFPFVDPLVLEGQERIKRVATEIIQEAPDIAVLQEVFQEDFAVLSPILSNQGYLCISFTERGLPDCDIAMFLFKDRVEYIFDMAVCLTRDEMKIKKRYAMSVLVGVFGAKNRFVTVIGTHLKAKNTPLDIDTRNSEASILSSYVSLRMKEGTPQILVCADLNDTPLSLCYEKICSQGLISAYSKEQQDKGSDFFTTLKKRGDELTKRCIDYVFFSSCLQLVSVRALPKEEQIPYPYLPSSAHPSDHLPLLATFQLPLEQDVEGPYTRLYDYNSKKSIYILP